MAKTTLTGYKRLPGKSARVQTPTGEIISQRQYRKLIREKSDLTPIFGGKKVLSNEALAKLNKTLNPEAQQARPARGRSSLNKLDKETRDKLAHQRALEREMAERERLADIAEQKKIDKRNKMIARAKGKPAKKFSLNSLRPGRLAFQAPFSDDEEIHDLLRDARKSGKVRYYAIGVSGVDERTAKRLDAMLTGLYDISYPLDEIDYGERTEEFLAEKLYFVFTNWFVHFSFDKAYAENKAARAGLRMGQTAKRKKRK